MKRLNSLMILGVGIAAGAAGSYWYAHRPEPISTPAVAEQAAPAKTERKILYYRNPMGLPDTSPVPKKDSMGMDYIPVYADEQDEPGTVRVSLDKVQRIGVKTEKVEARTVSRAVRGVGTVQHDESLLTIVTVRSDGYIEQLFVNKTGQHVEKGEPLFRFYSPQIQLAQADLMVAVRAHGKDSGAGGDLEGAMQKLRNLDVPRGSYRRGAQDHDQSEDASIGRRLRRVTSSRRRSIEGQRVAAGDELFRIADHSRVWVIADVAEADIAMIKVGTRATVTLRAFATAAARGRGDLHLSGDDET